MESLRVLFELQGEAGKKSETGGLRVLVDADVSREQFEDGRDRFEYFVVHVFLDDRHQHLHELVQMLQNNATLFLCYNGGAETMKREEFNGWNIGELDAENYFKKWRFCSLEWNEIGRGGSGG